MRFLYDEEQKTVSDNISQPHFFFQKHILPLIQLLHIVMWYLSIIDQLPNNLPTSERFTAEQVRKFLELNDDYSSSSSSSSSDCENDNISDISSDINTNESQSDEEDIIPPSPKRGKRTENKSVQKLTEYPKTKQVNITSPQLVVPVTYFTKTQYLYNVKHLVLLSH